VFTNDSKYFQLHQQGHLDSTNNLPSEVVLDPSGMWWDRVSIGIPTVQNLESVDLNDEAQRRWWVFANHQEHIAQQAVITPLIEWVYPFW